MKAIGFLVALAALVLSGASLAAVASKPVPKPGYGSDDYPASALLQHHEGTTYITVTVGKDGKPKDCVVTRSSGWADLDKATCRVFMNQVRFNPATDENGIPIEAPFATQTNWRIPR